MSTALIVVIVVAALILLALLVMLPRMRAAADRKKAERELSSRREAVAGEHRSAAAERESRAELAERRARMAQQSAERERAEANIQNERAEMHERGMADHELIADDERDRFADVANPSHSADEDVASSPRGADADGDGHTLDDRARAATGRDDDRDGVDDRRETTAAGTSDGTGSVSTDYEQGREDERRFERQRITDDVRESDRTNL
jgi:hypothetical protein